MKQITSILKFCIAFLAFIVCMNANAQGVILRKYGVAPGDESGTAVSLSGNSDFVAVGSPYSNAGGSWSGQVRVYNTYSEQIGEAINGASSDQTGSAISLNYSGTRIAIGAPFNNTNGSASGQVRIFDWNGTSWVQVGNALNGSQEGDFFGNTVSLSDNGMRLAIGAKGKDSNGVDAGQVRIYDWNGNSWNPVGAPINGNSYTSLGYSVSLSADGTTVAIGAPLEGGTSATGKVRLYSLNGNTWVQKGSDINGVLYQTIRFGDALSLSADGNRVAIGAPLSNSNSYAAGVVKIYDYNGSNWNQIGDNLIGQSHDLFGASVSLSADGSRLAVGAEGFFNQPGSGSYAKLYRWQNNNWEPIGSNAIASNTPNDKFGGAVSLSSDGFYLAVGAPSNDDNGSDSGRLEVFYLNNDPPVARCKNTTVVLNEMGTATIQLYDIDNGSTDDFNNFDADINRDTFTIADVGSPVPVTLTITDNWGQTDSCTAEVTVIESMISCEQYAFRGADPVTATYTVLGDELNPLHLNSGENVSVTNDFNGLNSLDGAVLPLGGTDVTWTAIDSNGNADTCTLFIGVEYIESPTLYCVEDTARSVDDGLMSYTVQGSEFDTTTSDGPLTSMRSNGSNDFSFVGPLAATLRNDLNGTATLAGEVLPLGSNEVTWTANYGNSTTITCSVIITVEDDEPPVITCVASDTRTTNIETSEYTVIGTEFDASFTDNSGSATLTNDFNGSASLADAVFPLGDTLVTWTVIDGNGNSNSCQMTVTVADTEAPAISCVQDATRSADSGGLTYTVVGTEFDASFADNSGNATLTNDFNGSASLAGAEFSLGDTLVTWTAVDGSGNSNSCAMTLTVADTEAPAISCVQDAIRDTDSGGLTYTVVGTEFDASFSDNSGNATLTNDFNGTASLAGAEFPLGNTLVAWTVVDGNGNTNSCVITVTVVANESPVISCNASVIQNNDAGQTGAFVTLPIPAVTDDLSFFAPSIAGTVTLLNFNDEGSLIDTPFAYDGATQETQDVVMEINYQGDFNDDWESMIIIGPDGTEVFSAYGFADNFYTSTINPTFVISKATWNNWVSSYGSTLNFVLASWPTVKNDRCTSRFPFGCEDDFIQLIKRGSITISNDYNDTKNAAASDFYPIGTTTVTYTAVDQFGATANCSVNVTVVDAEAPEMTCSETISLEVPSSSCTIPVVFNAPAIQDNISSYGQDGRLQHAVYNFNQNSTAITTLIPSAYNFKVDGPNVGIGDGGSDMYDGGNFITTNLSELALTYAENTVTNSEEFGPIGSYITKKVDNMWLLAANLDGITDFNIDGGLGADGNGVVDGYSSVIQVNGENYTIFVKRVRENPEANEDSAPSVNHLIIIPENPEASHNFSTNTDEDQHQVTGLQNTERLYYLLYASENSGLVDNATTESIATTFINSIASPSGTVIQTAGLPSGSEFPVGTTTNTFEATDAAGNTTTCSFDVTVKDNEAPVITCAVNDTRNTDTGTSEYTVQGSEFDATFTDNCTNAALTNDFTGTSTLEGAVLPLGDTVVTWTVDDGNGNTAHCSTTLTVNASIVDETSLLSSYTIIGRKGVSLVGTKVTGGVGVKGQNKVARIWALSSVNGFVKSKHIWKGWWSSVDSLIYERTTVNLPNFHENTADGACGVNITVAPSQTLTLTDQIYNNVTVRQGGTLIIDSPEVYIKKLSTAAHTTIRFNQSSAVMIDKTMQLGGNTSISQNTHTVTFYVEKEVTVGPGSQVNANIYTKQNLRLQPSSYRNKTRMTGQFIALIEVFASANSVWTLIGSTLDTAPLPNGPDNCAGARSTVMNQSTETPDNTDLEITITKDAIVLYPVPTRDVLNIKLNSPQAMSVNYSIVSVKGNVPISQTWDLTEGENTTKVDVSRLSEGQYYILFSVAGQKISKPFIIVSGR